MAWRAERHHLHRRASRAKMLDVIARIGGLHAQLLSSAELTAWARIEGLDSGAVRHALWEERSLVKTWAMRGTLHLLPSSELTLWQAAFNTDPRYLKPFWLRNFGVSSHELERLVEGIAEALDNRILTREELAGEVSRITGSAELGAKIRQSWGTMLKPAAFLGRLCFAPSASQNVRFTRPDGWVRDWSRVDSVLALPEITRRYLSAYGPATREDYARWLGVGAARSKALIADLGADVTAVDVGGTNAWMLAGDVPMARKAELFRSVRLLPAFDRYVVAASLHAVHLLPSDFKKSIYRPQGWISPVLSVNGRMDGVWKYSKKSKGIEVRIEPFVKLPVWARRAAEEEAEGLAKFLGGTLELSWK
jgi:hypothetical protein